MPDFATSSKNKNNKKGQQRKLDQRRSSEAHDRVINARYPRDPALHARDAQFNLNNPRHAMIFWLYMHFALGGRAENVNVYANREHFEDEPEHPLPREGANVYGTQRRGTRLDQPISRKPVGLWRAPEAPPRHARPAAGPSTEVSTDLYSAEELREWRQDSERLTGPVEWMAQAEKAQRAERQAQRAQQDEVVRREGYVDAQSVVKRLGKSKQRRSGRMPFFQQEAPEAFSTGDTRKVLLETTPESVGKGSHPAPVAPAGRSMDGGIADRLLGRALTLPTGGRADAQVAPVSHHPLEQPHAPLSGPQAIAREMELNPVSSGVIPTQRLVGDYDPTQQAAGGDQHKERRVKRSYFEQQLQVEEAKQDILQSVSPSELMSKIKAFAKAILTEAEYVLWEIEHRGDESIPVEEGHAESTGISIRHLQPSSTEATTFAAVDTTHVSPSGSSTAPTRPQNVSEQHFSDKQSEYFLLLAQALLDETAEGIRAEELPVTLISAVIGVDLVEMDLRAAIDLFNEDAELSAALRHGYISLEFPVSDPAADALSALFLQSKDQLKNLVHILAEQKVASDIASSLRGKEQRNTQAWLQLQHYLNIIPEIHMKDEDAWPTSKENTTIPLGHMYEDIVRPSPRRGAEVSSRYNDYMDKLYSKYIRIAPLQNVLHISPDEFVGRLGERYELDQAEMDAARTFSETGNATATVSGPIPRLVGTHFDEELSAYMKSGSAESSEAASYAAADVIKIGDWLDRPRDFIYDEVTNILARHHIKDISPEDKVKVYFRPESWMLKAGRSKGKIIRSDIEATLFEVKSGVWREAIIAKNKWDYSIIEPISFTSFKIDRIQLKNGAFLSREAIEELAGNIDDEIFRGSVYTRFDNSHIKQAYGMYKLNAFKDNVQALQEQVKGGQVDLSRSDLEGPLKFMRGDTADATLLVSSHDGRHRTVLDILGFEISGGRLLLLSTDTRDSPWRILTAKAVDEMRKHDVGDYEADPKLLSWLGSSVSLLQRKDAATFRSSPMHYLYQLSQLVASDTNYRAALREDPMLNSIFRASVKAWREFLNMYPGDEGKALRAQRLLDTREGVKKAWNLMEQSGLQNVYGSRLRLSKRTWKNVDAKSVMGEFTGLMAGDIIETYSTMTFTEKELDTANLVSAAKFIATTVLAAALTSGGMVVLNLSRSAALAFELAVDIGVDVGQSFFEYHVTYNENEKSAILKAVPLSIALNLGANSVSEGLQAASKKILKKFTPKMSQNVGRGSKAPKVSSPLFQDKTVLSKLNHDLPGQVMKGSVVEKLAKQFDRKDIKSVVERLDQEVANIDTQEKYHYIISNLEDELVKEKFNADRAQICRRAKRSPGRCAALEINDSTPPRQIQQLNEIRLSSSASKSELDALERRIMAGDYDRFINKPSEKCMDAAIKLTDDLRKEGYRVKIGGMYLLEAMDDLMPGTHFFVIATKDGKNSIIDLTAGQFETGAARVILSGSLDDYIQEFLTLNRVKQKQVLLGIYGAPSSAGIAVSNFKTAPKILNEGGFIFIHTPPGFELKKYKGSVPEKLVIRDEVKNALFSKGEMDLAVKLATWKKAKVDPLRTASAGNPDFTESWTKLISLEQQGLITPDRARHLTKGLSPQNYTPLLDNKKININTATDLLKIPQGGHVALIAYDEGLGSDLMVHALTKIGFDEYLTPDISFFRTDKQGWGGVSLGGMLQKTEGLQEGFIVAGGKKYRVVAEGKDVRPPSSTTFLQRFPFFWESHKNTDKLIRGDISVFRDKGLIYGKSDAEVPYNIYVEGSEFTGGTGYHSRKSNSLGVADIKDEGAFKGLIHTFNGKDVTSLEAGVGSAGNYWGKNKLGAHIKGISLPGGVAGAVGMKIRLSDIKLENPLILTSGTLRGGTMIYTIKGEFLYAIRIGISPEKFPVWSAGKEGIGEAASVLGRLSGETVPNAPDKMSDLKGMLFGHEMTSIAYIALISRGLDGKVQISVSSQIVEISSNGNGKVISGQEFRLKNYR